MSDAIFTGSIDDIFRSSSTGSTQFAVGNNFYGINHRQLAPAIASNRDHYGLTLFVRPQLNLSTNNIRNVRTLTPLLTKDPNAIQTIVRCLLDPRLQSGGALSSNCPFVDPRQAFIPILTNNLKSISGWPDIILPTTSSHPGAYQEEHSMVDGISINYGSFDLTAAYRNTRGDPIMMLFYTWVHYMAYVFEGLLIPYPDFIVENEIDYNTRIYRLVLDQTKTKVQKIAACGAAFPTSLPIGSFFDYSSDKPYNDNNSDINMTFKCNGALYQDDILVYEFNKTTAIFNPDMDDSTGRTSMTLVPVELLKLFNNRGYPRINPDTYTLEWWVPKDLFNRKLASFNGLNIPADNYTTV